MRNQRLNINVVLVQMSVFLFLVDLYPAAMTEQLNSCACIQDGMVLPFFHVVPANTTLDDDNYCLSQLKRWSMTWFMHGEEGGY